jgi:acyl-ACP thioesterase
VHATAGKTVGGVAGTNRAHFAVKDGPEAAFVHPSSVNAERFKNASEKAQKPVWILYHTKVKTKQVHYHTYILYSTWCYCNHYCYCYCKYAVRSAVAAKNSK